MKYNKNQFGVAHLAAILVIVGVIIIGLVGWQVWSAKNDKKVQNTSSTSGELSQDKSTTSNQSTKKIAKSTTQKYLDVKEYGLRLALTDGIEDAYYTINPSPPLTAAGTPYLSIHKLDSYPNCKIMAPISRAKVGDEEVGITLTQEYLEKISSIKIDEYYYWITPSKGTSCINDTQDSSKDSREVKAIKAFSEAKLEKL